MSTTRLLLAGKCRDRKQQTRRLQSHLLRKQQKTFAAITGFLSFSTSKKPGTLTIAREAAAEVPGFPKPPSAFVDHVEAMFE